MKMKHAICEKCGHDTGGMVPDDATDIICFACDQIANLKFIVKTDKRDKKALEFLSKHPRRRKGEK